MPWNEPGNKNNDPWNNDNRGGDNQGGPPDLEGMLKNLGSKLGGGSSNGKGSTGGLIIGAVILAAIVFFSGFYIINEGQRGLVLRFGEYQALTTPGLHWHIPVVEDVEVLDVDSLRSARMRATMLTQDENIVDIELSVQYRVKSAEDYAFEVRFPDAPAGMAGGTLYQIMESVVREVVGKTEMDVLLGVGREQIAVDSKRLMQKILDDYQTGLEVTSVNVQQAQPPEAVQGAFADAIKAREDEVRFKNEAEAYANGVIPEARGRGARIMEEAAAYRDQKIALAEGEAERFNQLLIEYEKAPKVTRERLYLETMQEVLANSSKVMIDVKEGNNMMYLPLDQLAGSAAIARDRSTSRNTGVSDSSSSSNFSSSSNDGRSRSMRSREVR